MTTIVANRRCMAADRQVTEDGISYNCVKIQVIDGKIVGTAGDVHRTNKFLQWIRQGQPKDATSVMDGEDPNFAALVLDKTGIYRYADLTEPDKITDKFAAIGSGGPAAKSVMTSPLNYTPARAVYHAMKVDPFTGGGVDVLFVSDL